MWTSFKNYAKKPVPNVENKGDGLEAGYNYFLFILDKWAKEMEAFTSRLSKKTLVCALGLFVILTGSACFYSISESLSNNACTSIRIIPISKPVNAFGESFDSVVKGSFISKKEFKRIMDFRIYLDSLARSPNGKRRYDSIDRCRPGLLDSLLFIEK